MHLKPTQVLKIYDNNHEPYYVTDWGRTFYTASDFVDYLVNPHNFEYVINEIHIDDKQLMSIYSESEIWDMFDMMYESYKYMINSFWKWCGVFDKLLAVGRAY